MQYYWRKGNDHHRRLREGSLLVRRIGCRYYLLNKDGVVVLSKVRSTPCFLSFVHITCLIPSRNSYFFGDITNAEAETILKQKKSGAWLVRFGEYKLDSPTREYILSVVYKHGLISHHKLTQNPVTGKFNYKGVCVDL